MRLSIGGGNLNLVRIGVSMLPLVTHEGQEIGHLVFQNPLDLPAVRVLTALQVYNQMLAIVVHVVSVVHTFLNALAPLKVLILVAAVIILELVETPTIVIPYAGPPLLLVGANGKHKETRVYLPYLLYLVLIPQPVNHDLRLAYLGFVYPLNDLVNPVGEAGIVSPSFALPVSMLLERFSPARLSLLDSLTPSATSSRISTDILKGWKPNSRSRTPNMVLQPLPNGPVSPITKFVRARSCLLAEHAFAAESFVLCLRLFVVFVFAAMNCYLPPYTTKHALQPYVG